jgi:hypothetical protein
MYSGQYGTKATAGVLPGTAGYFNTPKLMQAWHHHARETISNIATAHRNSAALCGAIALAKSV